MFRPIFIILAKFNTQILFLAWKSQFQDPYV